MSVLLPTHGFSRPSPASRNNETNPIPPKACGIMSSETNPSADRASHQPVGRSQACCVGTPTDTSFQPPSSRQPKQRNKPNLAESLWNHGLGNEPLRSSCLTPTRGQAPDRLCRYSHRTQPPNPRQPKQQTNPIPPNPLGTFKLTRLSRPYGLGLRRQESRRTSCARGDAPGRNGTGAPHIPNYAASATSRFKLFAQIVLPLNLSPPGPPQWVSRLTMPE